MSPRKTVLARLVAAAAACAAVGLAVLATPGAANAQDTTVAGAGSNVIGIDFEDSNFTGAALIMTSFNPGCTTSFTDTDASLATLPGGFSDEISSFRGFGGGTGFVQCFAEHFIDSNFGSAALPFSGGMAFVGDSFNDEASSIIWS